MGNKKFEITDSRDKDKLTLRLAGRLDSDTAPVLQKYMDEELRDVAELTLDLEALAYVSSAGLRVFLAAAKQMDQCGAAMRVTKARREVREVFAITGFDEILTLI